MRYDEPLPQWQWILHLGELRVYGPNSPEGIAYMSKFLHTYRSYLFANTFHVKGSEHTLGYQVLLTCVIPLHRSCCTADETSGIAIGIQHHGGGPPELFWCSWQACCSWLPVEVYSTIHNCITPGPIRQRSRSWNVGRRRWLCEEGVPSP